MTQTSAPRLSDLPDRLPEGHDLVPDRDTSQVQAHDRPLILTVDAVAVRDGARVVLPRTGFDLAAGEVLVVSGDPGPAHTALALTMAGRLAATRGRVSLDGNRPAPAGTLQRMVGLVDVPGVSDPDDELTLASVVAEELALAGLRSGRGAVNRWLSAQSLEAYADEQMRDVPADARTRVLAGLGACRPGVGFLVMVLPERHGEQPESWYAVAIALATVGFGVLVTATHTTAAYIDGMRTVLGNQETYGMASELDFEQTPEETPEEMP